MIDRGRYIIVEGCIMPPVCEAFLNLYYGLAIS